MWKLTRRRFVAASLTGAGYACGFWPALAAAQDAPVPSAVPVTPDHLLPPVSAQTGSSGTSGGMRYIWFGASASIPGERSQIVPDPNGGWVNRRTGQRYQQFDTPGPAGAGYAVVDVQGNAGNGVLTWLSSLLIH